jgi:hypothetical protein
MYTGTTNKHVLREAAKRLACPDYRQRPRHKRCLTPHAVTKTTIREGAPDGQCEQQASALHRAHSFSELPLPEATFFSGRLAVLLAEALALPELSGVASASERLMPAALLLSAAPLTLSAALLPECAAHSFLDASAASSPSPRFHVSSAQNRCFSRVFTCKSQSSTESRQLQQPPLLTPFNPVFPQPRTNVSAQWLLTLRALSRGVPLWACMCLPDLSD